MTAAGLSCWELFNPFDAEFANDAYGHYRRLRETAPIYFHRDMNVWLVSRYDDITSVMTGQAFGRAGQLESAKPFEVGSAPQRLTGEWLVGVDPPQHTRVRRCFAKTFSHRRVDNLRPFIEDRVGALLDQFAADNGGDFIAMVAEPLPFQVICHLLGIPAADHPALLEMTTRMLPLMEPIMTDVQRASVQDAAGRAVEYFDNLIAERRRRPGDDFVSHLIAVSDDYAGPDGGALTAAELMNNVAFLFGAGHETTTSVLGTGMYALLSAPDELTQLRADPGLLDAAVREIIRWEAPFQFIAQQAHDDTLLGTVEISAGQVVVALLGAGNHDPARFTDPDSFRVTRDEGPALSFGAGLHYCIGAGLAKLEAEVLFGELLRRFPKLLLEQQARYRPGFSFRALDELQMRVVLR
ncbi:cytochrome P450 [Streptomyces phaeofaciens JCM 4814]|uniref:Cytochrome P450 n=1 Tax=Streptomyces phaeofaciens TaxID=68254 RepID=A0A918HRG4_9ACTN|nr:cytochrome P450 [Streptomyces phaeofaciens]